MQLIKQNANDFNIVNRTELDVQISTAKAYPRDIDRSMAEAMSIIMSDSETAENCIYSLPRGKQNIEGPSVRLAEIIAYSWGNIHAATRVVGNDGKAIIAEGVAWDLEKNVKNISEVRRSILTKDQKTFSYDMQIVSGNAAASIALRNAIFRVIPKHIINKLYEAAVKTAIGDQKSLPVVRIKAITHFEKRGISKDTIFSYFGVSSIEELTKEHITTLIGKHNAIKDGQLRIDEAFLKVEVEYQSESDDLNKKLNLSGNNESSREWLNDYDKSTGEVK
jgi:hypothetical protein